MLSVEVFLTKLFAASIHPCDWSVPTGWPLIRTKVQALQQLGMFSIWQCVVVFVMNTITSFLSRGVCRQTAKNIHTTRNVVMTVDSAQTEKCLLFHTCSHTNGGTTASETKTDSNLWAMSQSRDIIRLYERTTNTNWVHISLKSEDKRHYFSSLSELRAKCARSIVQFRFSEKIATQLGVNPDDKWTNN